MSLPQTSNFQRALATWSVLYPYKGTLSDREHTERVAMLHRLADRLAAGDSGVQARREIKSALEPYGWIAVFDRDWPVTIYKAGNEKMVHGFGGR